METVKSLLVDGTMVTVRELGPTDREQILALHNAMPDEDRYLRGVCGSVSEEVAMTDFEKYKASAEARRTTHGDHLDKLTGYFLAETNRKRAEHEVAEHETPSVEPEPAVQAVRPKVRKRFGWLLRWRR
nr:hypothetical protein [Kibdelosporangium sp. MJ126-NF4]CEL13258.1 hypothetical protein [Kibdelosporangium sp. MJ126-NF4]